MTISLSLIATIQNMKVNKIIIIIMNEQITLI